MALIELHFSRRSVNVSRNAEFRVSCFVHVRSRLERLMLRFSTSDSSTLAVPVIPDGWSELPPDWFREPSRVAKPASFLGGYQDYFETRASAVRSGGYNSGVWLVPALEACSPGVRTSLEIVGLSKMMEPEVSLSSAAWADYEESYHYGVRRNEIVGEASVTLIRVTAPARADDGRQMTKEEWKQRSREQRGENQ